MKVLIVFFSILIINISFLIYQGDLGRYLRAQNTVKAVAEECGAGAALFFDQSAYSEGYLIADKEEALKHIAYILDTPAVKEMLKQGELTLSKALFFDDSGKSSTFVNGTLVSESSFTYPYHFVDELGKDILIREPSVVVTITVPTEDLFRLPFLEVRSITRSALYELHSL
jgi:hypothetical protein